MLTELQKYKLWDKRMSKIGPVISGIISLGFLLVIYLIIIS